MSQLLTAAELPDGLRAAVPALAPSQLRTGWLYNGGAFALAFALGWAIELGVDQASRRSPHLEAALLAAAADPRPWFAHRPLRDLPLFRRNGLCDFYFDWIEHETDSAWWAKRQVEGRYDSIQVPALHVGGWYDVFVDGTLTNWAGLRARRPRSTAAGRRPLAPPAGAGPGRDRSPSARRACATSTPTSSTGSICGCATTTADRPSGRR